MTDSTHVDLPPGGDLSADRLESYHYQAIACDIPSHMDQVADDLLDLLDVVRSFALQEVVLPTDAHCRETVAGLRATSERLRTAARATSDRPTRRDASENPTWPGSSSYWADGRSRDEFQSRR